MLRFNFDLEIIINNILIQQFYTILYLVPVFQFQVKKVIKTNTRRRTQKENKLFKTQMVLNQGMLR